MVISDPVPLPGFSLSPPVLPSPGDSPSGVLDPTKHPYCSGIDLGEDRSLLWSVLVAKKLTPGLAYICGWRHEADALSHFGSLVASGYRVALCVRSRLIADSLLGSLPPPVLPKIF